jgi:hypothetical protein
MQLETHEAQWMDHRKAGTPSVVPEVTRKGRLEGYCALSSPSQSRYNVDRFVAETSGAIRDFLWAQPAAARQNGSEGAELAADQIQSLAPAEIVTRFSLRPQRCGLDGPVPGAASKAGGTSVVQTQLNQNTEQHRCNAV